ncbi:MAG: aspartate/glutamate racemase family protein [Sulfitobacter sp.]
MRRIAILNPNATDAMTQDMVAMARTIVPADVEVIGATNVQGPAAIQGEADSVACLPGLFDMAADAVKLGADVIIIGCFDDTGLDTLRSSLPCPVIGLGEASMVMACLVSPRFAVVTTTQGSVPVIEQNITRMGLGPRCAGVYAAGIPVLELEHEIAALQQAISTVSASSGATAIILGCAGMSTMASSLHAPASTRLVDPVRAAVGLSSVLDDATLPRSRQGRSRAGAFIAD